MSKSRSDAQRIRVLVTLLGSERLLRQFRIKIVRCALCDLGIKSITCICNIKGSFLRTERPVTQIWLKTPHSRDGHPIGDGYLPEELELCTLETVSGLYTTRGTPGKLGPDACCYRIWPRRSWLRAWPPHWDSRLAGGGCGNVDRNPIDRAVFDVVLGWPLDRWMGPCRRHDSIHEAEAHRAHARSGCYTHRPKSRSDDAILVQQDKAPHGAILEAAQAWIVERGARLAAWAGYGEFSAWRGLRGFSALCSRGSCCGGELEEILLEEVCLCT